MVDEEEIRARSQSFVSYTGGAPIQATVLLCQTCNKAIPDISFRQIPKDLIVSSWCPCSDKTLEIPVEEFIENQKSINMKKEKVNCLEHHKNTTRYCMECMVWYCITCFEKHERKHKDHKSCGYEIKVLCTEHKKLFIKHCKNCNLSLCNECLGKHSSHKLINICKVNDTKFQQDFAKIELKLGEYAEKRNFFIKKIDLQIKELKDQLAIYLKLRDEVEEAYACNESINKSLNEFSKLIVMTSLSIQNYPNYFLSKQFQTLEFNTPSLSFEGDTLYDMCAKLKKFYSENYILKQVEVDEKKLQLKVDFSQKKIECFSTLTEFTNIVSSLIQLSGGHLAAGYHKEIKLWSNETYKCYASLVDHTDTVECLLQLSKDELASGSYDNTIKIWDLNNKRVKQTLSGHTNYVTALIQLKDGQLASSSDDKSIKIWNLKAGGTCSHTLTGHTGIVFSLVELAEGQIASGSGDQSIRVWNLKSLINKFNFALTGHTGIVFCLILLSNGMVASGSYDKTIKLWKIKPPKCEMTLSGHTDFVRTIYQLSDGRLMSGSADATIKFWDTNSTYNCLATISGHRDVIRCLIQLENGLIASGSWDMTIKLWTY